jgi:copper chaperone CopZ
VIPPRYDRIAATRVLAGLARPGLFTTPTPTAGDPRTITYAEHRLEPEPGRHLTLSQRLYLDGFMHPATPEQVTSATHRITWADSGGVPCTGHYVLGGLGPVVPIAARETTLALWRALAGDRALAGRIDRLDPDDQAILAGTTTDREPLEIFRIGVEATGRALAQHALLAGQTPYDTAAGFAAAMARSGLFTVIAGQWYWELQASTFRRGMIPVRLTAELRYPGESLDLLRKMKDATITDAHTVMARATTEEGLSVEAAVHRYHDDLDLISRQYALLEPGTRPRCLAQNTVLPGVADVYVSTFVRMLDGLRIERRDTVETVSGADDLLLVPDMNCRHCQTTIRGVLEARGVTVHEVDLESKRVVADFRSPRNRQRAADAIRDSGYTVLAGEIR